MYTQAMKDLEKVRWIEVDLERYKDYLKKSDLSRTEAVKERDLALELAHRIIKRYSP
jgi:hypothetical protein